MAYADSDIGRFTLLMDKGHKQQLLRLSQHNELTQTQVINCFLDAYSDDDAVRNIINARFEQERAAKADKASGRVSKRRIVEMMKDATPEQLEAIQRALMGARPV
jgi:hypothetical protein